MQTDNMNCPSDVPVTKHTWKKIVEKWDIGEGTLSDNSEFEGGEVELAEHENEVEEEVIIEPVIERGRNFLQLEIGQRINDAHPAGVIEHSNRSLLRIQMPKKAW